MVRDLLPERRRIQGCHRYPISSGGVCIAHAGDRVFVSGLQRCDSIWTCPICAHRIAEEKRAELRQAMAWVHQNGYQVALLTLTIPHTSRQKLKSLLVRLQEGRALQRGRTTWKRWARKAGLIASIRSLEVTYGEHGWNPHSHELLIFPGSAPIDLDLTAATLLPTWQKACLDAGLRKPNRHGLTLQDGTFAGNYVAKWGIEEEVVGGHASQGRDPWGLLRDAGSGDGEAAVLFREFADATKGQHRLRWSNGLRDLVGLDAGSNEEQLPPDLLAHITEPQIEQVRKQHKWVEALEVARQYGRVGLGRYLRRLDGTAREWYSSPPPGIDPLLHHLADLRPWPLGARKDSSGVLRRFR